MDTGFKVSQIDGSEHIFSVGMKQSLPNSYSYRDYLPEVIDQGDNPICVPCSVSAYLNWRINSALEGDEVDNRIQYKELYSIKTTQGDGMTYKEAFKYLRHHGVSYQSGVIRIDEYAKIKGIEAMKTALFMNGPCFGALPVYSSDSEFWKGRVFQGYHAISICGYSGNDLIIRNSWGKDWGDSGYSVLKYRDFNLLLETWTVI